MTLCQTFYCTNEKGKCEKNCFFLQLPIRTTLVNTSTSDHEKHGKVRQHWRQKRKKKPSTHVRIRRVKSDSYLTYGHHVKHTWDYT